MLLSVAVSHGNTEDSKLKVSLLHFGVLLCSSSKNLILRMWSCPLQVRSLATYLVRQKSGDGGE